MKKILICLAFAVVAISCKKVPQGGSKATLKLEEGVNRYSDDVQREVHGHEARAKLESTASTTDSTAAIELSQPEETSKSKH